MSPLLCGYVGETYGWHYGFGLATIGMLTGVAVFVAPIRLTQLLILGGALADRRSRCCSCRTTPYQLGVNVFVGVALRRRPASSPSWRSAAAGCPHDAGRAARRRAAAAASRDVAGVSCGIAGRGCRSSRCSCSSKRRSRACDARRSSAARALASGCIVRGASASEPGRARAAVRRADPDVLLDAVLGVLRAGRQLDQQLHRPQRRPRDRRPRGHAGRRRQGDRAAGAARDQRGRAREPAAADARSSSVTRTATAAVHADRPRRPARQRRRADAPRDADGRTGR